jgi:Zn-dependent alcohol dehydrogenase
MEGSGIVEAVGVNVTRLKKGDEVYLVMAGDIVSCKSKTKIPVD